MPAVPVIFAGPNFDLLLRSEVFMRSSRRWATHNAVLNERVTHLAALRRTPPRRLICRYNSLIVHNYSNSRVQRAGAVSVVKGSSGMLHPVASFATDPAVADEDPRIVNADVIHGDAHEFWTEKRVEGNYKYFLKEAMPMYDRCVQTIILMSRQDTSRGATTWRPIYEDTPDTDVAVATPAQKPAAPAEASVRSLKTKEGGGKGGKSESSGAADDAARMSLYPAVDPFEPRPRRRIVGWTRELTPAQRQERLILLPAVAFRLMAVYLKMALIVKLAANVNILLPQQLASNMEGLLHDSVAQQCEKKDSTSSKIKKDEENEKDDKKQN